MSISLSLANVANCSLPYFEWSARSTARRDERIIASFTRASSRAWVVRPRPRRHPVAAEEGHVGEAFDDRRDALEVDHGERVALHRAAGDDHVEVRLLDEGGGDREGIGDDREVPVEGQQLGEPARRAPGVDHQHAGFRKLVEGGAGDPRLLVDADVLALVEQRLVALLLDRHRPAVDAPDQTLVLQCREVPTDRLGGHAECRRRLDDGDPAVGLGDGDDPTMTLVLQHLMRPG